jgi:hypothetical protein
MTCLQITEHILFNNTCTNHIKEHHQYLGKGSPEITNGI